ncbi:MAG: hypothetical protein CSA15_11455 [Candidatus Delongbacteria bacterium]|nr:MAG: hypothetical protein CSA15_11455 [Candidatus Delongbacteria bacterium]
MIKVATIYTILFLSLTVFGENISDGVGIDKLKFARSVNKRGFFANYSFDIGDIKKFNKDSITYKNSFGFAYGITDGVDVDVNIPFINLLRRPYNTYSGFGDISIGIKYNLNTIGYSVNSSFYGNLTLPTGYSQIDSSNIKRVFTIGKKGYEVGFLMDWGKDLFSVHFNLAYFTKDNFVNDNLYDMGFNYSIGAKYRVLNYFDRNLFAKWSFSTTHWLYNFPEYIDGSTYVGLSSDIYSGFNLEIGYRSQLYDKSDGSLFLTLSYSDFGLKRESVVKPIDRYEPKVKLDLIEFEDESSLKTLGKVTESVKSKLDLLDEIEYRVLALDTITLFDNRESGLEVLKKEGRDIVIQGRVNYAGKVKGSFLWIPFIIDMPRVGYKIVVDFMAVDIETGEVLYTNTIEEVEYINNPAVFLRYEAKSSANRISLIEEKGLIERVKRDISTTMLREIYSKVD